MRIALLLVALLASGCVRTHTDPVTGKTDVDVESPLKKGEDWSGDLKGMGQWMGLSGVARARVLSGETNVTITLRNATPGGVHPWHLHDGACGAGGGIVGAPGSYTPLVIGNDGTASATAKIMGALSEAKQYSVNVHKSPSEMSTYVACGNIKD